MRDCGTRPGPPPRLRSGPDRPRIAKLAKLASKNLSSDETLAARVLGAYGDKDDVAHAFFSEYVSGSWAGPASARWGQLALNADEVPKRSSLPRLRRWAADTARGLSEMAERDRQARKNRTSVGDE